MSVKQPTGAEAMADTYHRLEAKIDELSARFSKKFDEINGQFDKIGRLEERITAYMAIAERIESASQQDIRELNTKYADHEARMRALEALGQGQNLRNRITDSTISKLFPYILAGLGGLYWLTHPNPAVTVTSAPIINPSEKK